MRYAQANLRGIVLLLALVSAISCCSCAKHTGRGAFPQTPERAGATAFWDEADGKRYDKAGALADTEMDECVPVEYFTRELVVETDEVIVYVYLLNDPPDGRDKLDKATDDFAARRRPNPYFQSGVLGWGLPWEYMTVVSKRSGVVTVCTYEGRRVRIEGKVEPFRNPTVKVPLDKETAIAAMKEFVARQRPIQYYVLDYFETPDEAEAGKTFFGGRRGARTWTGGFSLVAIDTGDPVALEKARTAFRSMGLPLPYDVDFGGRDLLVVIDDNTGEISMSVGY